ncbi:MAG: catechol 1,2-dioxygenase [Pseudomonadota bacterium]
MGEIVGAGLLSHAPTIMFPLELRLEINEGKEISLVPGLKRLRSEVLDSLNADTFVVFDTHWFTTVEFVVSAHPMREGLYTSEELPRGMKQIPYKMRGDPELANAIAEAGTSSGARCLACDDPCLPIHYPTTNLAHHLPGDEAWLSVSVCQTGRDSDFLTLGKAIGDAIAASDRRVVLIASGGMSHRFWPLAELEQHESSDPAHIRTQEARAADELRLRWFAEGDHARVIDHMEDYRPHKPEGMFAHYLMMAAALGGRDCKALGRQFSDYENATGTGQVHVWFDRPDDGWS